ncbi:MAG: phosphoribosylanthranilate isomerase [Alphaproteobacteria bacterium]|nr:phosphoribosylanthranilate isomerase [Alphaproteobacteria bacterium]
MRVKICGLTRSEDAAAAQNLGAWALGFIFYPKSKRFISADAAKSIIATLPASRPIGVFVNQTGEAIGIAKDAGLKGIQLHGDETPDDLRRVRAAFSGTLIKALRPKSEADLQAIAGYKGLADYILLDAAVGNEYGGTGHTGDWSLAQKATAFGIPVIVAGGLDPDNIAAAYAQTKPYALDLSSGVEASPGIKDHAKLQALFANIKGSTHAA